MYRCAQEQDSSSVHSGDLRNKRGFCEKFAALLPCLALFALSAASARGDVIIDPVSVTSPQGNFSGLFALVNMINQSGLSATYTSGVTDFATFTATTTHSSPGSTNSGFAAVSGEPQQFIFDLGSVMTISAIAFWDTTNVGSVTEFQLFSDNDNSFSDGTTGQIGSTFNAIQTADPTPAQVFTFAPVTTRFIDLNVLADAGGTDLVSGIGEIAFASPPARPFLSHPACFSVVWVLSA